MYDNLKKRIMKKGNVTSLFAPEEKHIVVWKEDYKFKDEIILEAVSRCMKYKNKLIFPYITSILDNWYRNGVTSFTDILELDEKNRGSAKTSSPKQISSNQMKCKKHSPTAILPKRNDGTAGYDLHADTISSIVIGPHSASNPIPTNISFDIPDGYMGVIYAQPEIGARYGIRPRTCGDIITGGHGAVSIVLFNDSDTPYTVFPRERIAQIVFQKYCSFDLV